MAANKQKNNDHFSGDTVPKNNDPAIVFKSITFSDGTKVPLDPRDVIVFVGPNNAGKSVALRELEKHVEDSFAGTVVTEVEQCRTGTLEELFAYLRRYTRQTGDRGRKVYSGYRVSIREDMIEPYWSGGSFVSLAKFFCMRLQTETRITDSNPAPAIRVLEDAASHPIHMLYSSDELERKINNYFRKAFGEDLVVYRRGGREIPLLVGKSPDLKEGEDRVSDSYCHRLTESTVPLKEQGDGMRSFASVILHLLAPITPSILILDEPEAFLHPPQAKLLGELIAKERSSRSQLFIATHSPDVLSGLLNVAPEHLRVLRIQRKDNVNHVKELNKERAKEISADPLMKYSSVLSGLFHRRVIICESDGDCTFYSSLLDLPEIHGEVQPDVLFVHANGKDRMAKLAKALKELDVPVDIIADIDILRNEDVLKKIIETLGGDWKSISPMVQTIRTSVEASKPYLNAGGIKQAIDLAFEDIQSTDEFSREKRQKIETILKKTSPWDFLKKTGESAIPSGQATNQFKDLKTLCEKIGLWIVPVGELEGFCRSINAHGPRWVQMVIEGFDLSTASDLKCARDFMRRIWVSRSLG